MNFWYLSQILEGIKHLHD